LIRRRSARVRRSISLFLDCGSVRNRRLVIIATRRVFPTGASLRATVARVRRC
jgi:hypothetical protein